jgi:nucleoside-diphosphate-sugar epimerase
LKALITGATGFIGSHLAEQLLARGYDVRAVLRPTSDKKYIQHLPLEYVNGGFANPEALRDAVEGVDAVYHVAGVVASKDRKGFFEGNQLATRNLLEAVRLYNPGLGRFIHVSSQAAVGPSTSPESPVDESAPLRPITTSGESKAAAEEEVLSAMKDIPSTIVRPPAVYGPRDVGVYSFFKVTSKGFSPLIGFDRKLVSLVHVGDLVRGFIEAGESPRAVGETYFISSEQFYTWEEVGEVTAKVLGRQKARFLRVPHSLVFAAAGVSGFLGRFQKKPPILDYEKGRDITRAFWICSVKKATEHFGYHQEISLESGVASTIAWYKEEGWL